MIKIGTVEDFIISLKEKIKNIKPDGEVSNIWFRGEDRVDILTPLMPKLYRIYNDPDSIQSYEYAKGLENNIKSEFTVRSIPYLQKTNIQQSNWNSYFLMQHYGLETRLLDWTESALIALFFSIQDLSKNDSRVWLLNPHRLNEFTTKNIHPEKKGIQSLINPSDTESSVLFNKLKGFDLNELARIYLNLEFDIYAKQNVHQFYPLAIIPSILDERMNTQSSCFTIFGNITNGLVSIKENADFLDSIIINAEDKRSIREELRWLGISQKTIYPDLQGLSKSISDKYNSDHLILKRTK